MLLTNVCFSQCLIMYTCTCVVSSFTFIPLLFLFLIICEWLQTLQTARICLLCSHEYLYTHVRGGFYWFANCKGLVHNHCAHFRSVTICWVQSVSPPMCSELTVSRALPEENKAILKYFLVLLYYILLLELRHCKMKLKGRHFHFSINTDGNLGVSLQMCETLNFIDLCEKEELRSIFLTLHKSGIGKILVQALESKSSGKKRTSIQQLPKKKHNQYLYRFYKNIMW